MSIRQCLSSHEKEISAGFKGNYTSCHWYKMLTSWLTFTVFLAGSANPEKTAFTVAPTCRVKVHPEEELTLKCGDRKSTGVVQYWHTPFGELQNPGFHSNMDPVFMDHDGKLVVLIASVLHSGLYYCLLQHTEGTTLWPYQLHVSHDIQKTQEDRKYEQNSSSDAFRFRRDVGSEAERQEEVSDGQFTGAVAASVLLTFVVGFSAGALTRSHVLRCLGAVTTRMRSLRDQQDQTETPDHGSGVTMTTLPPMYDTHVFEEEQEDDNSSNHASRDTTISSTTSSPPAKPKRSFRLRQQEEEREPETMAYLEGCDNVKTEERRMEEKEVARSLEEMNIESDGETEEAEERGFYLLGDEGSETETGQDECSEREEKDRRENKEENKEWRQEIEVDERDEQENRIKEGGEERRGSEEETEGNKEKLRNEKREEGQREEKEVEEASEQEDRRKEGGEERRASEEEAGVKKEKGRDEKREEGGGWREDKERDEDGETGTSSKDSEAGSKELEDTMKRGKIDKLQESVSSPPRPPHRKRIIRLYQYDDDGQRYSHLPDPTPDEPVPAPRLKQRSLSLTRLSAIMAAASAGPLERTEAGKEQKPQFHMEI